jgi:hypothetical protein
LNKSSGFVGLFSQKIHNSDAVESYGKNCLIRYSHETQ